MWFLIKIFRNHFRTVIVMKLLFYSQHVGHDACAPLAQRPEDWMGSPGLQPQPQSGLGGRGLRLLQSSGHATNLTRKWRHGMEIFLKTNTECIDSVVNVANSQKKRKKWRHKCDVKWNKQNKTDVRDDLAKFQWWTCEQSS